MARTVPIVWRGNATSQLRLRIDGHKRLDGPCYCTQTDSALT